MMSLGSTLERRMCVRDEAALERWPFRQEWEMEEVHETTSSLWGISSNGWSPRLREMVVLVLGMFGCGLGMRWREGRSNGEDSWLRGGRAIFIFSLSQ